MVIGDEFIVMVLCHNNSQQSEFDLGEIIVANKFVKLACFYRA